VADLSINHHLNIKEQRILVLGAGGAVAGILGSLLADDPREVVLVNRNLDRASDLAKRFSSTGRVSITDWKGLPAQGQFNLLINATSLGHHGDAPPLEPSAFASGSVCYDLNYHNASQPLKERCEEMQQAYIDGLGMLVEQAARSFQIWTGKQADTRVVIDALR
jgi:shikimate dehydrogenase